MQAMNPYLLPMWDCTETALAVLKDPRGTTSLDTLDRVAVLHACVSFAHYYAVCAFLFWACNQPEAGK